MMESLIRHFVREGPAGWNLLSLVALGAASPLLLILLRRKHEARGAIVLWLYSTASLTVVGIAVAFVHRARQASLPDLLARGPATAHVVATAFDWSARTQWVVGLFVLVTVPVVGALIGARRLRANEPFAAQGIGSLAVLGTCAAVAWFAALGWFAHATSIQNMMGGCWEPSCRYEALMESFETLSMARSGVVAAGLAASVAVPVVVWLRPLHVRSAAGRSFALIALSCGVWAYCLARPMARDAARPLPFCEEPELPAAIELPAAKRCEPVLDAPVIMEAGWGLAVDGRDMSGADELRAVLDGKRELWTQLRPTEPFPGVVQLLLSPYFPAWEAGKLVRVAREAGYRDVRAGVAVPQRAVRTHTVGEVEYSPRYCSIRLPRHVDWAALASWEEAVEQAERR